MGLSGSQKAYKNARAGVARAGASRSNYYTPVTVAITINGVNRRTSIMHETLRVSLALNDEPDTAFFTMKPGSTKPTVFQPIVLGLGAITSPIFAGSVVSVTPRRYKTSASPFYDVQCVDWLRLFNRRRVNRIYRGAIQGATIDAIVINVINLDTSGFTFGNVQASAVVPDQFTIEDETPSEILTRLVHLNGGGGWYIDPNRDVHFFGASGDPNQSVPATIADTSTTVLLSEFRHTDEGRELRNRVTVKGQSSRVMVTAPNDYANVLVLGIPIEEGLAFGGTTVIGGRVSFGGQVFSMAGVSTFSDLTPTPAFCTTTALAAIGATSIAVDNVAQFGDRSANSRYVWGCAPNGTPFALLADITSPTSLHSIPASGYGSIVEEIPSGTVLQGVDTIRGTAPADGTIGFDEIPVGETARVRVVVNNTGAQTSLAAIEGGDGIHEHIVDAPNADYLEAAEIGQAELDLFSAAAGLPIATWVTRDMNTTIGGRQTFSMAGTDPFSDTLTITRMELTWPVPDALPFRRCEAADVKLKQIPSLLGEDQ